MTVHSYTERKAATARDWIEAMDDLDVALLEAAMEREGLLEGKGAPARREKLGALKRAVRELRGSF